VTDDGGDGSGDRRVRADLSGALEQICGALGTAKRRGLARWGDTPFSVKIAVWLPFQAVMFRVQPILWRVLTDTAAVTGNTARVVVDSLATLGVQTQLLSVLVGLFALQTTILSLWLDETRAAVGESNETIEEILVKVEDVHQTVERAASAADTSPDGGTRMHTNDGSGDTRGETTGTGALGGAVAGGAFGASLGGPAGAIGGAVLGLILGDEAETRSVGRRRVTNAEATVLEDLIALAAWEQPVSQDRLLERRPPHERDAVRAAVETLDADPDAPVAVCDDERDRVQVEITGRERAVTHLRRLRTPE
jgi:hypothetical protein